MCTYSCTTFTHAELLFVYFPFVVVPDASLRNDINNFNFAVYIYNVHISLQERATGMKQKVDFMVVDIALNILCQYETCRPTNVIAMANLGFEAFH